MREEAELPTDSDIYSFMDAVPRRLRQCAASKHQWDMVGWTGYTASGRALKAKEDPNKAKWIEVIHECKRCHQHRTHEKAWQGGRLRRVTGYTYSDRNKALVSPAGVSQTNVNVRAEMPDLIEEDIIMGRVLHIEPTGATKTALKRRGAA